MSAELLHRPARGELGATAVEYALMVSLIAIVIFAAVGTVGTALVGLFEDARAMFTPSS